MENINWDTCSPTVKIENNIFKIFNLPTSILAPKFLKQKSKIESMGGYIAGGFARAMAGLVPFTRPAAKYSDIDIFLKSPENYGPIYEYLANTYDFTKTTTYNNFEVDNFYYVDKKIQLIRGPYLSPQVQINNFDISVCKAYILGNFIYMDQQCEIDCKTEVMHYTKIEPLLYSDEVTKVMNRLIKYFEKGFNLNIDNLMKIYHQIREKEFRKHFVYCLQDYRNNVGSFDKLENIDKFYSL